MKNIDEHLSRSISHPDIFSTVVDLFVLYCCVLSTFFLIDLPFFVQFDVVDFDNDVFFRPALTIIVSTIII